jgi:hypothetical protein
LLTREAPAHGGAQTMPEGFVQTHIEGEPADIAKTAERAVARRFGSEHCSRRPTFRPRGDRRHAAASRQLSSKRSIDFPVRIDCRPAPVSVPSWTAVKGTAHQRPIVPDFSSWARPFSSSCAPPPTCPFKKSGLARPVVWAASARLLLFVAVLPDAAHAGSRAIPQGHERPRWSGSLKCRRRKWTL